MQGNKGSSICLRCNNEFKWRRYNSSWSKGSAAKYCSRKCMDESVKTWNQKNRFIWSKASEEEQIEHLTRMYNKHVIKNEGCWDWNGFLHKTGYAIMKYNEKHNSTGAHRISWYIHNKEFPEGLVLHNCDNKKCTNPNHLYLGTPKDNCRDREFRKRSNPRVGEDHPNSKLTIENVKKIKELLKSGVTMARISRDFNISESALSAIKKGLTWKYIN